jgi:hypothetical protein
MLQFEPVEHWLPVPGYEGFYDVSDMGRVRSLRRKTRAGMRGGGMLKQHLDGRGHYLFVTLCREGETRIFQVHALVALAFIGPRPAGLDVCHGPGGMRDNRASQLRYDTRAGNMADCLRDGTDQRGEKHYSSKLTWSSVAEMRQRFALGETQVRLAADYDVNFGTVHKIVRNKRWRV